MSNKLITPIILVILAGFVASVSAISQSDFKNVIFNNNRGSADDASRGHVTYNIGKG